jgi:putative DNA primase/helicase
MNFAMAQNQAQGKWHDILSRLGVDGKYLTGKHSSCPVCGGKDRFRFDDKGGRGSWICSSCGAGDGFALVSKVKGMTLAEAKDIVEPLLPSVEAKPVRQPISEGEARSKAKKFWSTTTAVTEESPVAQYMINRLGKWVDSDAIRMAYQAHPAEKGSNYPVMAAKVSDHAGGGVSVHRTFLLPTGRKAGHLSPNKMLMQGVLPQGSAIRLFPVTDHMAVAEGIETALAAFLWTGIPTWSAINAPLMKSFDPPKSVKKLTIFSDNDANYTGQSAAYELARRLVMGRNISVEVRVPPKKGEDWLDHYVGNRGNE